MRKDELNKAIAEFFGYTVEDGMRVAQQLTSSKTITLNPPLPIPDFIKDIAREYFTPKAAAYWLERDGK